VDPAMAAAGVAVFNGYMANRGNNFESNEKLQHAAAYDLRSPVSKPNGLPRAASYTYLPPPKESTFDLVSLKGSFSEEDLIEPRTTRIIDEAGYYTSTSPPGPDHKADASPDPQINHGHHEFARRRISIANPDPTKHDGGKTPFVFPRKQLIQPATRKASDPSNAVRRGTWLIGSRSASPSDEPSQENRSEANSTPSPTKSSGRGDGGQSPLRSDATNDVVQDTPVFNGEPTSFEDSRPAIEKKATPKKLRRPLSMILSNALEKSDARHPVPSLPKSFSTDRLPSFKAPTSAAERVPSLARMMSSDKLGKSDFARKKDELWSVFRALDGDSQK
jgi:hypothetical protein